MTKKQAMDTAIELFGNIAEQLELEHLPRSRYLRPYQIRTGSQVLLTANSWEEAIAALVALPRNHVEERCAEGPDEVRLVNRLLDEMGS